MLDAVGWRRLIITFAISAAAAFALALRSLAFLQLEAIIILLVFGVILIFPPMHSLVVGTRALRVVASLELMMLYARLLTFLKVDVALRLVVALQSLRGLSGTSEVDELHLQLLKQPFGFSKRILAEPVDLRIEDLLKLGTR